MATYIDDTFTGTLNTNIDSHAPDTGPGGNWQTTQTAANKLNGAGNAYRNVSTTTRAFVLTMSVADYRIHLDVDAKSILASDRMNAIARFVDDSNHYLLELTQAGVLNLYKIVAGVTTQLGAPANITLNAATTHTMELIVQGSNLRVLWDTVEQINVTDSAFAAAGKAGFRVGASSTTQQATTTGLQLARIVVDDAPVVNPPVNTVAPVITTDGTPATTETVTCSDGTWTNNPTSITKQWQHDLGSGFVNIAGQTGNGYTLQLVDEGKNVRCVVTATNAAGSTSANSNTITPAVSSPLSGADIAFRLSGGASNTSPANSYGGAKSTTEVGQDLLDTVSNSESISGVTAEYRLTYVHNSHAVFSANVKTWISEQLTGGLSFAIGWATEAAGSTVAQPPDDKTAPVGVTFSTPADLASAIDGGTVGPGQGKGLWLKRIVDPLTSPSTNNAWEVSTQVSQL